MSTVAGAALSPLRRRPRPGALAVALLATITLGAVAVFVVATAVAPRPEPVWWLDVGTYFTAGIGSAVLVLIGGLARPGDPDRAGWLVLGAGLAAFTAGDVAFQVLLSRGDPGIVTAADAGFLAIYPATVVALGLLSRGALRTSPLSVRLDGLVIALGAATLTAFLALGPVWRAAADLSVTERVVTLAYPVSDLVVIGVAAGLLMVLRRRARARWLLLLGGIAFFALGDTIFIRATANGTYAEGGLLDTTWPIGAALLVAACWLPTRPRGPIEPPERGLLVAPLLVAGAATALLVAHPDGPAGTVTMVLAALTVLASLLRVTASVREAEVLAVARHEADTDPLTGLANRRRLQAALATAAAEGQAALLLFDLDRFKEVNDALGHHTGDGLLRTVADRLHRALDDDAVLARFGGDEFAVVLPGCDAARARAHASALVVEIGRAVRLDGIDVAVGASAGVASCPEHGRDPDALLRGADAAMYRAKRERRPVAVFDAHDARRGRERLRTRGELRDALQRGELDVDLQPQVDARGRPTNMEALVRWAHPTRGRLGPGAFLDVAEEAGLQQAVTDRVLEVALRARATWPAGAGRVAVNLAAVDLLDVRLPERIDEALAARGLPGTALELEVTEDHVVVDPPRVAATLGALRARGITVALDDFGTGHSSLAYLQQLPLDTLKLARSIATEVDRDERSRAIVRASVELGHALGLVVIAEGVEDEPTAATLRALGADAIQGYLTGRPMLAADAAALLHADAGDGPDVAVAAAAARTAAD